MKITWILVADETRCRLFQAQETDTQLAEIQDFAHPQSRLQEREIISDAHGRFRNDAGIGSHNYAPQVTQEQHEAMLFAKEIAAYLDKASHAQKYEKLFIIAPPAFLGMLRKNLSQRTQSLVREEIAKDLSKMQPRDIREHLPKYL